MTDMQPKDKNALVKVAKIVNVHGVKGAVKVKLFIDEDALFNSFEEVLDVKASSIPIKIKRKMNDHWMAQIDGVIDRTAAEAYKGRELYVQRADFPELDEDEFYLADLIGFEVRDLSDIKIGKISAFHAYGDSHLLEIQTGSNAFIHIEFTKAGVPNVDMAQACVRVDLSQKIDLS